MPKFIIQGGNTLQGNIKVTGFKNAATPILAATILSSEEITLHNVPVIEDVKKMIQILVSLGSKIVWTDSNSLKVDNANLNLAKIDMKLISDLRSSILLMGALIGRFSKVKTKAPGGCQIGNRSMDTHFKAFQSLGIAVTSDDQYYYLEKKEKAKKQIVMSEFSVTGTENIILAAALGNEEVNISIAASDSSVQDLCWFLKKLGVEIEGIGTHNLKIKGSSKLAGTEYYIMPDPIETGTFIALAGATKSKLVIENTAPDFIKLELEKFKEVGLKIDIEYSELAPQDNYLLAKIIVDGRGELKAISKLHDMPYPGFSADMMQPFAVLMTQAEGTSLIHDWMYDARLKYVAELKKMGANIVVSDPHRIVIIGPSPLFGKKIYSFDLRAGATLIIAALAARGRSVIDNIYQVDRGYEALDTRLAKIGASIERVKD